MKITKKMLTEKIKQVEAFEARWGECTSSRAMRKYCTDAKYRKRSDQFQKAITEFIEYKRL